uniref:Uncharacterized protein n=1 Tax=Phlebotomus papatasi TaxID=29031 RepID=A0A1B0CZV2_PHLPP
MDLFISKFASFVTLILAASLVSASVTPAVVDIARTYPPNVYPWVQETNVVQRLPVPRTPIVFVGHVPHIPPTVIRYPTIYHPSLLPPFSYYGGVYPGSAYPGAVYPFLRTPSYFPNTYPFVR